MPNLDTPFGARLVGHTSGSPLNARIRQYTATTATAVFPGDFVKMVDAGTVEPAAAGDGRDAAAHAAQRRQGRAPDLIDHLNRNAF